MVELEAPMRGNAFGLLCSAFSFAQFQGASVIDGRQAAPELHFAFQLQFLRGFIGWINTACLLQLLERSFIPVEPGRLTLFAIRLDP